jgi:hypothetical protein
MKLITPWGVRSPRLDRLIAAECSHCDGGGGRLVRHDARRGGTQVWLSCASCCARLGNALPHSEQPRWVHIRARGSRGLVHLPAYWRLLSLCPLQRPKSPWPKTKTKTKIRSAC